jgi:hypothetical protein
VPTNIFIGLAMTSASINIQPGGVYTTIVPVVLDGDIVSGSKVVNYANSLSTGGNATNVAPIMVGEPVKLKATPAATLTDTTWYFDSSNTNNVVGSYGLVGNPTPATSPTGSPAALVSPSPVATATNPTTFYWITGDRSGWISGGTPAPKEVLLLSHATGVSGDLGTYVLYPVAAPSPKVAASASPVALPSNLPVTQDQCPGVYQAIAVGDICNTANPNGITWKYSVTTPSYGAGYLTMAQLAYATESGTNPIVNGGGSFGPFGGPPYYLDSTFPLATSAPTGTQWTAYDAPYFEVANEAATFCATVNY